MEKALEKILADVQWWSEEPACQYEYPALISFLKEAKAMLLAAMPGVLAKNQFSNSAIMPGFIQSEI